MYRNTFLFYLKVIIHGLTYRNPAMPTPNTYLLFSCDGNVKGTLSKPYTWETGTLLSILLIPFKLRSQITPNCPQIQAQRLQAQSKNHLQEADNKVGPTSRDCVPSPPECPGSQNPFPCCLREGCNNSFYGLFSSLMKRLALKAPSSFSV